MKKTLIGLALMVGMAASAFAAPQWTMLLDSNDGEVRMLVDATSYSEVKGDDGTTFLAALFKVINSGVELKPFVFLTEKENCNAGEGKLYSRTRSTDGSWKTVSTWWWSHNGDKMYDYGGQFLCRVSKGVSKSKRSQSQPET